MDEVLVEGVGSALTPLAALIMITVHHSSTNAEVPQIQIISSL